MDTAPKLSIVIPAYNESVRLPHAFRAITTRFEGSQVELIIADDGSVDGTADVARSLNSGSIPVTVVSLDRNRGKGAAVRSGVRAATGDRILIMDADLATDLEAIDRLSAAIATSDIAIGSRSVAGSTVKDPSHLRRTMGRTFNRLARTLLHLRVSDSQCGFKMFRADAAQILFTMSNVDGFAYDAEVIRLAMILDMTVTEVPVHWTAIADSKVRPLRDSIITFRDLLAIRRQVDPAGIRTWAAALGWTRDRYGNSPGI